MRTGTGLCDYIERATEPTKKVLLQKQWDEACHTHTITCACGLKRHLTHAFRCLYCGVWFCRNCAEHHFGQTIQEWITTKTNQPAT